MFWLSSSRSSSSRCCCLLLIFLLWPGIKGAAFLHQRRITYTRDFLRRSPSCNTWSLVLEQKGLRQQDHHHHRRRSLRRQLWSIESSSGEDSTSHNKNHIEDDTLPPPQRNNEEEKSSSMELLELFRPSRACKVDQMSGTDLAYIGDVVFELFVRSRIVWPSRRTSDLQDIVVSLVRAENQSLLLEKLKNDFPLSEQERRVLLRGRNSVTRSKNRRNPAAYQDSTSFEALIGYLYISDPKRCTDLFQWLEKQI